MIFFVRTEIQGRERISGNSLRTRKRVPRRPRLTLIAARRPLMPRSRVRPKNRIGAPLGDRVLSTKYFDKETGLYYYGLR